MKEVKYLVLHCTATRLSQRVSVEDIDRWHKALGWEGIGYHWFIDREGHTFAGRPEKQAGAHVKGYNDYAIGICYEGGLAENGRPADTRTQAQKDALFDLLICLHQRYPHAVIMGHNELNPKKACPCFDAEEYRSVFADSGI